MLLPAPVRSNSKDVAAPGRAHRRRVANGAGVCGRNPTLQFAAAQRDLRESETFIYHAASGQVELVRRALDRNWELLHSIDRDGHTALHAAAAEGNLEVAELLLSRGANPSSQVRLTFSCALGC
jgi:ankyrin repeat protein